MLIEKHKVVSFHYLLSDTDSTALINTREEEQHRICMTAAVSSPVRNEPWPDARRTIGSR